MGWLRLVGSLKLYVSLQNIGLFYRALLQKRPVILKSLLAEANPYDIMLDEVLEYIHDSMYEYMCTEYIHDSMYGYMCTEYIHDIMRYYVLDRV